MWQVLFIILFMVAAAITFVIDAFVMVKQNAEKPLHYYLPMTATTVIASIMLIIYFYSGEVNASFFCDSSFLIPMVIMIVPPFIVQINYGGLWAKMLLVIFGMFALFLTQRAMVGFCICMIISVLNHYCIRKGQQKDV